MTPFLLLNCDWHVKVSKMKSNGCKGLNTGFFLSLESPSNYSQPNVVANKFTWTGSIYSNPGKPGIFQVLFSQLDKLPLQLQ